MPSDTLSVVLTKITLEDEIQGPRRLSDVIGGDSRALGLVQRMSGILIRSSGLNGNTQHRVFRVFCPCGVTRITRGDAHHEFMRHEELVMKTAVEGNRHTCRMYYMIS